ncbi:MAG: hypothetical protein PHO03_01825 [Candidatus Omnitrophica bacterium]|jgi:hypothetical protein|nr:hypothetical protein [Candidatus Omnitrophota bacterium]
MNIAIISDFNIGGQPTALTRAINKYTKHKARCIIAFDDSFAYDKDIILNSDAAKKEAADWCNQCDFFHFGRGIFNWPGVDFNKLLNKNNCCVKYYGSELRENSEAIKAFHEKTGVAAITGTGWSITGLLPNSYYHLNSFLTAYGDMKWEEIPLCVPYEKGDPLKICAGSAGHPLKGYDVLGETIKELQQEGEDVELNIIQGMSNKEALEKKRESHVTFTSLHSAWGISGVESMYLGHVVMSCLDPWIMTFFPDNPTVIVRKDTLKRQIKNLIGKYDEVRELGTTSRLFAFINFQTRTILKKYLYLFDLIMHRELYLDGFRNPDIIYRDF